MIIERGYNMGVDESNNGRFPAIYVQVSSNNSHDVCKQKRLLSKSRKNHDTIARKLRSRDYNFLLFSYAESKIIQNPFKRIGIILASLIYEKSLGDHLKIYLDGEWGPKNIDFAKNILKDTTGLEKDVIEIFTGAELDRKIPLVNIADETAHWLLKKPLKSLRENKHKKELLLEEFRKFF